VGIAIAGLIIITLLLIAVLVFGENGDEFGDSAGKRKKGKCYRE
jgi:hypothetical protein